MKKIIPPTQCPSCNAKLEWSNHLLYCRNPICGEQSHKKLEHFAKALKIKGLGPASIKKLEVSSIPELYELSLGEISNRIGSEKLAIKLYSELMNSTKAPLEMVLPAFSIPLIGKTASDKLSKVCKNIYDINRETCRQAGLGEKTTDNLIEWLDNEWHLVSNLPFSFEFSEKKEVKTNGKVVCISGRLKSYKTKADATEALTNAGYAVKSSVTKDVTILINESGIESSKTEKARLSGVEIVTDIKSLIGEK